MSHTIDDVFYSTVINTITEDYHKQNVKAGWWNNPDEPNVPRRLMLIVSEIAEAMEADRKGLMDSHLPHRKGIEVELADAIIRIFDLAGGLNLDLGGAMIEKVAYNKTREDHKLENRAKDDGKKY